MRPAAIASREKREAEGRARLRRNHLLRKGEPQRRNVKDSWRELAVRVSRGLEGQVRAGAGEAGELERVGPGKKNVHGHTSGRRGWPSIASAGFRGARMVLSALARHSDEVG